VSPFTSGIYAVPASGGAAAAGGKDRLKCRRPRSLWPVVLPHNNGLIFTVWTGKSFNETRIEVLSFKTGKRKILIDGGTDAHYLANGISLIEQYV